MYKTAGDLLNHWQQNKPMEKTAIKLEAGSVLLGALAGGLGGADVHRTNLQLASDMGSGALSTLLGGMGGAAVGTLAQDQLVAEARATGKSPPTGMHLGDKGHYLGTAIGTYSAARNAYRAKQLRRAQREIEELQSQKRGRQLAIR